MRISRQWRVPALATAVIAGFGVATADAASDTWMVGTNGDYAVAGNWVGGNVPNGAADNATIEGSTSVVGFSGGIVTLNNLDLALSASGGAPTFNQTGGSLSVTNFRFGGGGASRNPTYNLSNGTLNVATAFGSGGLTKLGTGTLSLTGPNSYSGTTTVSAGALRLGSSNALADGSTLVLAGGTLIADGESDSIASLDVTTASIIQFGDADATPHALTFAGVGSGVGSLSVTNWSTGVDQFLFTTATTAQAIAALTTFIDPSGTTGNAAATVVPSGDNYAVVPVPEPAGVALLGFGAVATLARRRRIAQLQRIRSAARTMSGR